MKEIKRVFDFYDQTYLKSYNLDKSMQYLHELIEDYKSNYKEEGSKD